MDKNKALGAKKSTIFKGIIKSPAINNKALNIKS